MSLALFPRWAQATNFAPAHIQGQLFPFLDEEVELTLTPKSRKAVTASKIINIEQFFGALQFAASRDLHKNSRAIAHVFCDYRYDQIIRHRSSLFAQLARSSQLQSR